MSVKDRVRGSRRAWPPSREEQAGAASAIVRATVGVHPSGLRITWANLDEGERRELVALTRNLQGLTGRERRRFERLTEKGAGLEGVFARDRDGNALARATSEL